MYQLATLHDVTGYINAGGRGTRLNGIFTPNAELGISKALLAVGTPPITLIQHQINRLISAGVANVVAGIGDHLHVGNYIKKAYEGLDDISAFGVKAQLGNGGDLVYAAREHRELFGKSILITNVDGLLNLNERAVVFQHRETKAGLTIVLTLNKNVPNERAYYVASDAQVIYCSEATVNSITRKEAAQICTYRGSSTGVIVVETELIYNMDWDPQDGSFSLYKDIVAFALGQGVTFAYNNGTRFFIDVGTVASWNFVTQHPEVIQPYLYYEKKILT